MNILLIEDRVRSCNMCQESLKESLSFKVRSATIEQSLERIVRNQYSIMESLYVILEDIKTRG